MVDRTRYGCSAKIERQQRDLKDLKDHTNLKGMARSPVFQERSSMSLRSLETELSLTTVACSSLEETLADYRDLLRIRELREWDRDHSDAGRLRALNYRPDAAYETFRKGIGHLNLEIYANVIISPIEYERGGLVLAVPAPTIRRAGQTACAPVQLLCWFLLFVSHKHIYSRVSRHVRGCGMKKRDARY
jgi:hypothetical protein